jgi:hypothetical protein
MHVHPARLILALALLVGCKSHPAPALPPTPPRASKPDLCGGRARCALSRQSVAGAPGVDLVTVRVAHVLDASTDEEHCDRREYWLSRASGDILVAVDCETQWGADSAGPATVKVEGKKLHVRYTELQSSDGCETYSATVDVAGPRLVEAQSRVVGSLVKDVCKPGKQAAPPVPPGDGTAAHPLLTLRR